jgi:hypothetical protein
MTHSAHTPASPKAKAKRPLAPDTARLDPRSARAWTEPMATAPLGGGRYAVESSTNEYRVDLTTSDCTCLDHGYRGARCKHLRRVAVEVTRGDLPAPGRLPGTAPPAVASDTSPRTDPDCVTTAGSTRTIPSATGRQGTSSLSSASLTHPPVSGPLRGRAALSLIMRRTAAIRPMTPSSR